MHLSTVETLLEYEVEEPTHFCFNIEAAQWPTQTVVSERLAVPRALRLHRFADRSGNRFIRCDAAPGPFSVHYKAEIEVHSQRVDEQLPEVPVGELPDEILQYLLPTRYCESDLLGDAAQQLFGDAPPGIERVRRIVKWVHDAIRYEPGSTDSTSTAHQVYTQRAGVCRDFAHVGVTLCRALNIPARLVVGYVWFEQPPQDFHAIFEAWLGGQWVLFDPTGMAPVERLARIATGPDAKDVAFSTFFGTVEMTRKVVTVLEHEPRGVGGSGEAMLRGAATAA